MNRIVFATQKGGAGKSTSATMLASYMYFVKDHQLIVIDADSPQHSIARLRDLDKSKLTDDEATIRAFHKTGKTGVYMVTRSKMKDVFERPSPTQPSTFEKASLPQLGADTIIIDTPGSVAVDGIGTILQNVDRVIVPLEPEEMSFLSSIQFLAALAKIRTEETQVIAFWNKIRYQSHKEFIEVQTPVVEGLGVKVLKNVIPESVKMKRDETRSTIMPINFNSINLEAFMEELYNAVKINK